MILDVITRQVEPDITVLEFAGRMTLGNRLSEVERSIREMIQGGCRKLVMDLSRLDFMDSSGVGVMVMSAGAMDKAGGEIRVAGPNSRVSQVFEVTHLGKVVPILATADAAVRSLAGAATSS